MHKSQANRARIAQRAATAGRRVSRNNGPMATDLARRTSLPTITGQGPRKGRVNARAWSHRDSTGRVSDWDKSPNYFSPIEVDVRWSA